MNTHSANMMMFLPEDSALVHKLMVIENMVIENLDEAAVSLEQWITLAFIQDAYGDTRHQWHNTSILVHTDNGHFLVAEDGSYLFYRNDGVRVSGPGPERISLS